MALYCRRDIKIISSDNRFQLPKSTVFLPLVIFHLGTWLSLAFRISPGTSFWYWPIPLGLVLVQWWGWRVIPWIFINSVLSASLWGIHSLGWSIILALPETLVLALSFWLFNKVKKGQPQLTTLTSVVHYLVLGIAIPVYVGAFVLQVMLLLKSPNRDTGNFLWLWMVSSLNVLQSAVILSPLLLIAFTDFLNRYGWVQALQENFQKVWVPTPASKAEIALAFGLSAPAAALLPVDYFPFVVSGFALWSILRMEIRISLILNLWLLWATITFHDLNLSIPFNPTESIPELLRLQLTWIIISVSALTGGYTLQDMRNEIHLRQTALRALRESQTRFREIANFSNDVIFLVDRIQGFPVYLNPATQKVLGSSPESLLGKTDWLTALLDGGQEDIRTEMLEPRFWQHSRVTEIRLKIPEQGLRWIRLRMTPSPETAELPRIPGFLSDITEVKIKEAYEAEQQEQMQQTDKLASLGKLVAGVAHEINNPNALILLGSEALQDVTLPQLTNEEKRRMESWVKAIQEGSSRITRIVTGLKDFARVDTETRYESISIDHLLSSSLIIVGHLLRQSTHHFELFIEPDLPDINGHFQKLEQVVINLVRNACQALEHSSQSITLRAEKWNQRFIAIRVVDTGPGIDPKDLPHVFEPFFTTKRDAGSTGLGLSVAFGIAQEHGGQMTIESRLGEGTTVSLILPLGSLPT